MSEDTTQLLQEIASRCARTEEDMHELRSEVRPVLTEIRDWMIAQKTLAADREEERRELLKAAGIARDNRARLQLLEMSLPTGERPSLPPQPGPVIAETDRAVAVAVAPPGERLSDAVIKITESTSVRVFSAGAGIVIIVTAMSCAGGATWSQLEGYITRVAGAVAGAPVGPPAPPPPVPMGPSPAP